MPNKLIPRRLVQLEAMNRLKPPEMAEVCGVSLSTYHRYKSGEIPPDYYVLKRLVDRFKIDAGWLFSERIV